MDHLEPVYSGWAGDFSLMMSRVTEPPRSFYFLSALTCLGVLLSDRITLASEIAPQPRLYTLILGESADDRKSTAIKLTLKFFREALTDFPVCWGVGSAEGLAEQFKSENKLLLVHDEFKTFVSKSKIETSVLLPAVNTLFEDNRYQSTTKTRKINLKDVHLSMLAASTVDTYSTIFDSKFMDIGFVNRLFVVKDHGHRRWSIPPKIYEPEKDVLKKGLQEILQIASRAVLDGPLELPLTVDAGQCFDDWYFELPQTTAARRLDTYGHRFMPLLALNDKKTEVDLQTVKRTVALLDHELRIREEVDPIDADSKVAAMEERVRRILRQNGGMVPGELKRQVHYSRHGLWVFENAMRNLMRAGEVKFDRKARLYDYMDT